ncbi:FecCD family ABC transporter permease [Ensifer sp. 4252]|uniref:FecCD family ABC transporter permease n=1 Tax=Ensifer sp. 4252 TaxID=3373915 RepID=UPI003D1D32A9
MVVRAFAGRVSFRVHRRVALLIAALAGLALTLMILSLSSGRLPLSAFDIWAALAGDASPRIRMVVVEWRLPRVLLALLLGAALGLSGAIFQSLTRNPLGSPDIIGFSTGSYSGALVVMLIFAGVQHEMAIGAVLGGLVTAAIVYTLAWKNGIQGFRLIIVGIGVSAMLGAVNLWLMRQADLQAALAAAIWGAGSLNGLGNADVKLAAAVLLASLPLTVILARAMRQLELGDDLAVSTGVSAGALRLALLVLGVALTATVTALSGPIAFVALAAPQIARRLARLSGVPLASSALVGSLLLLAADVVAQHAFASPLPVGVMTVSIGGLYFVWLLLREIRRS